MIATDLVGADKHGSVVYDPIDPHYFPLFRLHVFDHDAGRIVLTDGEMAWGEIMNIVDSIKLYAIPPDYNLSKTDVWEAIELFCRNHLQHSK
jgi:hypothetical protein